MLASRHSLRPDITTVVRRMMRRIHRHKNCADRKAFSPDLQEWPAGRHIANDDIDKVTEVLNERYKRSSGFGASHKGFRVIGPAVRHRGFMGAVFAGGVAAAAFSLILLTLGTGLGLTAISPWSSGPSNAKAFGFAAVVWICVTSILTSGLGGYLAGRLRSRWLLIDNDEVHFRDTAHGFLSWAVATLLTAAVLTSTLSGVARVAAQTTASGSPVTTQTMQRGNAEAATNTWPLGYFVDSLFRMPAGSPGVPPVPPPVAAIYAATYRARKPRVSS